MTGLSLRWYGKLMSNEAVLRAFRTSMWIALVTSVICTIVGVMGAVALVRYEFPGKTLVNTLIIAPALVPETVLGVGLLLLIRFGPAAALADRPVARPYPAGAALCGAGGAGAPHRHQAGL